MFFNFLSESAAFRNKAEQIMNYTFPFTAIVGMDLVKRSLLYHAIDPRLGGLLLMGHRGCAKSTLARAFREILPALETAETTPFVEVPL